MAPKRKRVWKRDESAKEARRARRETENEKNAIANAKARVENSVQPKFERERASIPPPIAMSKEVESSPLVKAMENGFLDDLKMFRVKDHKFLVPIFLNSSNVYNSYIVHALQGYLDSTPSDELDKAGVERVLTYFEDDDWEEFEYQRATHLIQLLQANDFYYRKNLWENEDVWKEEWKTKRLGKWKLLHPLKTKEMQDQIRRRVIDDENIVVEPTTTKGRTTSSSTTTSTRKGVSKAKAKSPNKRKPTSKGKGKGKDKGKG